MKSHKLINLELGLDLDYWNGEKKTERVFPAQQIMRQLGFKGGNLSLSYYELDEGIDKVTLYKKNINCKEIFGQLTRMNLVGLRTGSVIMLYESGVWKLIMQSKKKIGIKTRNWLAREVLPSIMEKGYYSVSESELSPLSYLHDFTEEKEQKNYSKSINAMIHSDNKDFRLYHNKIHNLVNGMNAKEIQTMFNSKESAREIIRQNIPENAATMAIIDDLYLNYQKSIEEIENSNIHKTMPPAIKSLYQLGININKIKK